MGVEPYADGFLLSEVTIGAGYVNLKRAIELVRRHRPATKFTLEMITRDPLEIARDWHGRHRRLLTSDLDQALLLIGACFPESGINAADTLKNQHFRPHVALGPLLDWFKRHGGSLEVRKAATIAEQIYRHWASQNQAIVKQMEMFDGA